MLLHLLSFKAAKSHGLAAVLVTSAALPVASQKAARQLQRHDSTPTPLAHLLFLLLWGLFIVIHRLHLYYYRPAAGLWGSNLLYTSRRVVYTSRTTTKVVNLLSSGLT